LAQMQSVRILRALVIMSAVIGRLTDRWFVYLVS
jgi:hypothetical protein